VGEVEAPQLVRRQQRDRLLGHHFLSADLQGNG
jgi:hypothetical protein